MGVSSAQTLKTGGQQHVTKDMRHTAYRLLMKKDKYKKMALRALGNDLLGVSRVFYQSVRTKKLGPPKERTYEELDTNLYPDEYCIESHGMKYYPRSKDYKDPPYNPSKLLLVKRISKLKGVPWYYIKILENFGIAKPDRTIVNIVENIPSNNRELWKVRHLIDVKAITFPHGEPTAADINRTLLNMNGEMLVSDTVVVDPKRIQGQENIRNDPKRLDGYTLKFESRKRWMSAW